MMENAWRRKRVAIERTMKTRKYVVAAALVSIALLGSRVARGDDVTTYDFTGALTSGAAVTGQFKFDSTTGKVTAFDFRTPFSEVVSGSGINPVVSTGAGFTV